MKERARSATVGLPFETVPQIMVIALLEGVERWLNVFPTGEIDESRASPAMIVEGRQNLRDNFSRVAYGSYALVYICTSNTLESRTVPAIALRESNNNGGHYFMSLKTSKRNHSNKWVEMPITNCQINQVHELADMEGNHYWMSEIVNHEDPPSVSSTFDTSAYEVINDEASIGNKDEEEAINSRIGNTNQNLESDQSASKIIESDITSETYSDSKDSTYINESDEDSASISAEINSDDFSFNIQNAYEAHTTKSNDIDQEKVDIIPTTDVRTDSNEASSISDIDIPIMALSNDGGTEVNTDSTS